MHPPSPSPSGPDPVAAYLFRLGTAHSRRTVTSAVTCLERLHGAPIDWPAFTYQDALQIRSGLNGFSHAWRSLVWSVLRQILTEAKHVGVVDREVVEAVRAIPAPRGSSGRLGRDVDASEIDVLIDVAAQAVTTAERRDAALLALAVAGALRRSELVTVMIGDYDPLRRVVRVRHGKGRRQRGVPLPPWATETIDRWVAVHPGDGWLLLGVDRWGTIGGPLAPRSVGRILHRICERAGIEPLGAHALRAQRITQLCEVDPLLARQLAGHANLATTARYDRRGEQHLATVVDQLDTTTRNGLRAVS